ncbi:MAG: LacI family DNA-binding transcriptional regulator [Actinomycetaceae bacterium]|nr:LacI family DNA-binding transcriptional regulator [Actinomycetaceae bacterium]
MSPRFAERGTIPRSTTPRLVDVARHAGVSTQTVSRVVRGMENVAPETRHMVQSAVDELGYMPNLAARAMASRSTGAIQVVIPGTMMYGYSATFIAISQAISAAGYHVSVTMSENLRSSGRPGRRRVAPIDVDGLVVMGSSEADAALATEFAGDLPVVLVLSGAFALPQVSTVSVNQRAGVHQVMKHLTQQGLKDIVHIVGPRGWVDSTERLAGYLEACALAGIESRTVTSETWESASGYNIGKELARGLPQAVFAANDQLALGCMRAFHEAGISIPEQCAFVGFDNSDGCADFFPSLTSVSQEFTYLGVRAVEALRRMGADGQPRDELIVPVLHIRSSSSVHNDTVKTD